MASRLSIDHQVYGDEPTLTTDSSKSDVIKAWNWFNYFRESDDAKTYIITYLKKTGKPELAKQVASIKPLSLRTIGWGCRILTNGGALPHDIETDMWKRLTQLVSVPVKKEVEDVKPQVVVSVQEKVNARSVDVIAHLEDQIDIFIKTGENDFDVAEWLRGQALKPAVAKKIIDFYTPLYAELFEAHKGSDKELRDAYSHLKKTRLKRYMEFVKAIVSAADTQVVVAQTQTKKPRKARKKKVKPASVQIAKLKYKEKDDEFGIKSIKSADIIGAQQLWVFNTKYRALTVLNALGESGLSVKGTTVLGFDEKTSITKKIRKPETVLPRILDGGKIVLRNIMKDIKTRESSAKGRINSDVVILRALK
jgi:hypothetical protein